MHASASSRHDLTGNGTSEADSSLTQSARAQLSLADITRRARICLAEIEQARCIAAGLPQTPALATMIRAHGMVIGPDSTTSPDEPDSNDQAYRFESAMYPAVLPEGRP